GGNNNVDQGLVITVDGTSGGGGRLFRATGTGGVEAMTIKGSGAVGIGTTAPSKILHIYDAVNANPARYRFGR
ncbi:MAG: hypothetical protein VYA08_01830, partial [Pseudomonadota bacterium]|nr:hypothetical protein [Pseudomonadota bacterium]